MKNLIALIAVVALVGVSFAQDLDCPQTGTAQSQQVQQQAGGSIYDQLIAKMLETEQAYISRTNMIEWHWMRWSISIQYAGQYAQYAWDGGEGAIAQSMWEQLSPAEKTAFQQAAQQSWNRVIAAGLN